MPLLAEKKKRAHNATIYKQTWIAKSTMELVLITLDKAGEEVEWLFYFLEDMPMWMELVSHIYIHYDNQ